MKFVILYDFVCLTASTIGKAMVCSNPYTALRDNNFESLKLYKCEDEAPEGKYDVRIYGSQMCFENGKIVGCVPIDLNVYKTIVFEPTSSFDTLRTGLAKTVDVLSMSSDAAKDNSFILISESGGPSGWITSVLENGCLDFGGESVIDVMALM